MTIRKVKLSDLGRKSLAEFKHAKKYPCTLLVDNVRSAYNVGSFFRTADAFLLERIVLCGKTPHPDSHISMEKTALSATQSMAWEYVHDIADMLRQLKTQGYHIVALEQTSQSIPLQDFRFTTSHKIALICGNEIEGVSDTALAHADTCIEIPQQGTKHSLNVSVAVAICLWHIHQLYAANRIVPSS